MYTHLQLNILQIQMLDILHSQQMYCSKKIFMLQSGTGRHNKFVAKRA